MQSSVSILGGGGKDERGCRGFESRDGNVIGSLPNSSRRRGQEGARGAPARRGNIIWGNGTKLPNYYILWGIQIVRGAPARRGKYNMGKYGMARSSLNIIIIFYGEYKLLGARLHVGGNIIWGNGTCTEGGENIIYGEMARSSPTIIFYGEYKLLGARLHVGDTGKQQCTRPGTPHGTAKPPAPFYYYGTITLWLLGGHGRAWT